MTEAIIAKPEPRISHTVALELLAALRMAKETIRVWHNLAGGSVVWGIYDRSSPEMVNINGAIARAEQELSQ